MFDQVDKFLEKQEYDKAVVLLEVLKEENPNDIETLGLLLNLLLHLGQADKALVYAEEFLKTNQNLDIMGVLGMILVLQNKLNEAKKIAEDMVKLDSESIEARTFLINCRYMLSPQDDSVLVDLKLMHEKDPYDLVVLFYYSLYLKEFARMQEYKQALAKMKELDFETAEMIENSTLEKAISAQIKMANK